MLRYFFTNETETPVDPLINTILSEMKSVNVMSEEYPKLMTYLERLYKIKETEKSDPVSRDTIALILGNLMGILMIVAYEQKHVMTSKGFSQIIQPKRTK